MSEEIKHLKAERDAYFERLQEKRAEVVKLEAELEDLDDKNRKQHATIFEIVDAAVRSNYDVMGKESVGNFIKRLYAENKQLEAEISTQSELIAKLKANFLAVQNEFINEKREREQAAATFRTEIAGLRAELSALARESVKRESQLAKLEAEVEQMKRKFEKGSE